MPELPTGTLTFLFADLVGSTRLWEEHPEAMREALARHDAILRDAVRAQDGQVVKSTGDGLHAVFETAHGAAAVAVGAQRVLAEERWGATGPLRVRMGLHTGEAEARGGDYYGPVLNRAARLTAAAHGGQILVTQATEAVLRDHLGEDLSLVDLGEHRLRDLSRPEHVFQLQCPGVTEDFPPLRSLEAFPGNLPLQLTSFVGRGEELAQLRELIARTRLLTLNGAGGCGKTRLGLQLAADMLERYPGGAWLAELAPVVDPDRVAAAVASALGERDLAGDLVEVIVSRVGDRHTLIVLDNCEHLLDLVAGLVDALLRRCPNLTVMATSREPLGVPGETAWRVPSLSVPGRVTAAKAAVLSEFDAVRLFVERAGKARPKFRLTAENAPAVMRVCQRLDGVPLAIELAAARVRGLTVEQVASGLDDRFRLLTGGARTVLPRQQTLQASVDWSYDLLSESERKVFRQLAVFAGGFTLDAAEHVVAGHGIEAVELLDVLLALVDKSMVDVDDSTGRFGMLETLRQYGAARLVDAGETTTARDRHLGWTTTLFEPIETRATGDLGYLSQVAIEVDNLRVAYEWALTCASSDAAYSLATTLMAWETDRGDAAEAVSIGSRALAMPGGQLRLRLLVMGALVMAHFEAGDLDACNALGDTMLDQISALGAEDVMVVVFCLRMAAFTPGRGTRSGELIEQAMQAAELAGTPATIELVASILAIREAFRGNWRDAQAFAARIRGDPATTIAGQNALSARIAAAEWTGRFGVARAHLDELTRIHAGRQHPRLVAYDEALRVRIDLAQGRDSGAAARVAALLDDARRRRFLSGIATAGWAPGAWALGHGDVDAAVEALLAWRDELLARDDSDQARLFSAMWWGIVPEALLAARRIDEARAELDSTRLALEVAENRGYHNALANSRRSALEGFACRAENSITAAEHHHHEALAAQHAGGWRPDIVHSLEALAGTAASREANRECARLAGAAQALRDEMGFVLRWPFEQQLFEGDITAARTALSDADFDAAYSEGRALDIDAAVAYAKRTRGDLTTN